MFIQLRLFFRIASRNREVYVLKIITLGIAFACSALVALFSLNEFGYDRAQPDHPSIVRILERNNKPSYNGNRLSSKIPSNLFSSLQRVSPDSLITSRVKLMNELSVLVHKQLFYGNKFYAADPDITQIFSFDILDGPPDAFREQARTVLLSSAAAMQYFGTIQAAGQELKLFAYGDTLRFTVAAVYKDFPKNSHEEFRSFIRYDSEDIKTLNFSSSDVGIYGKLVQGDAPHFKKVINNFIESNECTYSLQPISEIYFGPMVAGEDATHGDRYSVIILVCITSLILFLALASYFNLTSLTLPYRSRELAIKKLAGTSQLNLIIAFAKESFLVIGASLILGVLVLVLVSSLIKPLLLIDITSLLKQFDFNLALVLAAIFLVMAASPLLMALGFTRATPIRLLRTDTITFPRFKKTIMLLQLGISIFLMVASMVIRRQINYSLLKEPGRNHEQVVYVNYPQHLTNEGLMNLRASWKRDNPNIIDIMATSKLPNRVNSQEVNSSFYVMSVDRGFKDFFNLEMVEGNWFGVNDGDSIIVVNEQGKKLLASQSPQAIGVFRDLGNQFNLPEKPIKINIAPYYTYNFLCIRVLEVDIRSTVHFLENYFDNGGQKSAVSFLNKHFEEWLRYQDRLNKLSEALAIISGLLSCFAIYGLSIGIVRDKLKQIAIHKLFGANTIGLTRLLVKEFVNQLLLAILIFGPMTYLILNEMLRTFAYSTHFTWSDPLVPLAYCATVIALLCGLQTLSLNRADLSSALKG